jgi:hypothetical protein
MFVSLDKMREHELKMMESAELSGALSTQGMSHKEGLNSFSVTPKAQVLNNNQHQSGFSMRAERGVGPFFYIA